MEAENEVLKLI